MPTLVFASRAWFVGGAGFPVPFWDQWDGEGLKLYRPWLDNSLTWHAVLAPHNEHRMALTRLADLALVAVIGRWDTWWQLLLNAGLHAMTAALVVGAVWPALTAAARPLFAVAIGVLFALPTDWQNALWGFQSAFYFAPLLAVIAAAGMANARLGSVRWWLGGGAAALALFSHAGGILVAAAVFGSLALALVLHAPAAKIWPTLVFTACVLLAGIWLHAPQAQHTIARAQTIAQFLGAFTRCLAWPYVDRGSWALLLQLPLLVLIFADWRAQRKPDAAMQFAMALGLFAVLQAAAVAYSRAGTLPELRPLSRYYNPFFLGVAAQIFALCKLAERYGRAARLGLLGWSGIVAAGLLALTLPILTEQLPDMRRVNQFSLAVVRDYLVTGDVAAFNRRAVYPILHPDPEVVRRVLDDPTLRPLLPLAFTAPDFGQASRPPALVRLAPALTLAALIAFAATLLAPWRRTIKSGARPDGGENAHE